MQKLTRRREDAEEENSDWSEAPLTLRRFENRSVGGGSVKSEFHKPDPLFKTKTRFRANIVLALTFFG